MFTSSYDTNYVIYFLWRLWPITLKEQSARITTITNACEFPAQRPVTRSFDVFFDLRLNKRLCKKSWGWWFETLSCPLWRHCNDMPLTRTKLCRRLPCVCVIPHLQGANVPDCDMICVRPGDIIGIQYTNKDTAGVVPYEQSGRTSTAGISHNKLSKLFNEEVADSSLPLGKVKTATVNAVKRLPALKPILS